MYNSDKTKTYSNNLSIRKPIKTEIEMYVNAKLKIPLFPTLPYLHPSDALIDVIKEPTKAPIKSGLIIAIINTTANGIVYLNTLKSNTIDIVSNFLDIYFFR